MNVVTILLAILVFGLLIFIHELGHYLAARWSGIKVNEFALGMGPTLVKFVRGETTYALRAFPIGGFCAMEGENEDSGDTCAFCNAKLSRRVLVTVAGATMNILLGLALLLLLSSQMDRFATTTIGDFKEGAVSDSQLQVGDTIVKVNGHKVNTYNDITYEFLRDRDGLLELTVLRDEQLLQMNVQFEMYELAEDIQGIFLDFRVYGEDATFLNTIGHSLNWTKSIVKQVWGSLVDLVTGRYTLNQLSGPVGVTSAIGEASTMGWESLLLLVSYITVNLGVFNLLPIPALDGGRLLFLLVEAVRRKPLNTKYEAYVHLAGFVLLIGLMAVVTLNDILRLF